MIMITMIVMIVMVVMIIIIMPKYQLVSSTGQAPSSVGIPVFSSLLI